MSKIERLADLARGILPPDEDNDPRPWRINVFLTLIALVVVLTFHLASASGYLERFGISGVANTSDVRQNGKVARAVLRRLALPEIRAKVRERCQAQTAADRERINRDLDRILEQFKTDTGEDFSPLPTCTQV